MGDQNDSYPKLIEGLKEALLSSDWAKAAQTLEDLKKLDSNPLNIGITGVAYSGKSSFVNAFRGIDDSHEDAAPTGCTETPSDVKPYPHPEYPNVTLWDLPGVGTTTFPADEYLRDVRFRKLDFFIIIIATRFRENDVKLAVEIQKMGKKFYFIRSKIDHDVQNEQRNQRAGFNAEALLTKIKQDCIQGLQKQGFASPRVFLLSSSEFHLYDFALFHETFQKDLPALREQGLLFTAADISQEIINKKKGAFLDNAARYAAIAAAGAAVPVPGLYVVVYVGLMVTAVRRYAAGFGLDALSSERLAANMRVPLEDVKAIIKSPLTSREISKSVFLKALGQLTVITALTAAKKWPSFIQYLEKPCYISIFGTIAAMSFAYFTTSRALKSFLDVLADDAQRVFQRALGL